MSRIATILVFCSFVLVVTVIYVFIKKIIK